MRAVRLFVITTVLAFASTTASAQVSITAPAAGTPSSYRTSTIAWEPIPGATSYHLEIDDDPNFGSPEVDVTVPGTGYTLSGERLKLHGQPTWAAYVRINGVRWNAGTFTASYFKGMHDPALAVDSRNRVYMASTADRRSGVQVTTSSDWSGITRLSLADTFNADSPALAVDESDVVHVFWLEQRPTENRVPYYTNSSTGWNLVRIPGTVGGCSEGSMITVGARVDVFYDSCSGIDRFTTTDGITFTNATIPYIASPTSISTATDAVGNVYVASGRPPEDYSGVLQVSADGWIPREIGAGRYPGLAVTATGEQHVLRTAWNDEDDDVNVFYSNSLRSFETWTELPIRLNGLFRIPYPLVIDEARHQLYAAFGFITGGAVGLCSAAYTGLPIDTGTSWNCSQVGNGDAIQPDLVLGPDGTLHVAWSTRALGGAGYANSLGSFLAKNFPPEVRFGPPTDDSSAVILPSTIFDKDRDDISGQIEVGRHEHVVWRFRSGRSIPFFYGLHTLTNISNSYLVGNGLQFRPVGSTSWDVNLYRNQVPTLPAMVEVRLTNGEPVGGFVIMAWDDVGIAVAQGNFVPSLTFNYSGTLPDSVDISALSDGDAMVKISVSDGSTTVTGLHGFTKTAGQTSLVLKP
jgi:hypothetical protein